MNRPYKFSAKAIARHKCNDCGVNVIKAGDYCLIGSGIWERRFKLGWDDNLCLACIETRLGRPLTILDFSSFPYVDGYPASERLLAAYGYKTPRAKKKKAKKAVAK